MKKAYLKYISALLLFGSNGIVASKIALTGNEIVFLRTLTGSILLIILFLFGKGKFHITENKKDALFIALSGVAMGTSWMFLYEAYQLIGVSLSSLLYYSGPVIVMILSPIIFKENLTVPKIAGFLMVVLGIILVNGNIKTERSAFGVFCGMMSAVMYFFMVTLNKQSKNITGTENSVIQLTVSFLTVAVFTVIKQGFIIDVPKDNWIWIIVLGVVNTGIGCYLYFSSLSTLPVQTVAIYGYLEPLSAVVLSALLLNEKMTAIQIVGAVFIIGGAMTGELVKVKR